MAESMDDTVQAQMRELCDQLVREHDLPPEAEEEILGHIEDKMLAYLHGEEPLTQADALILVRQHFGRPEVLVALRGQARHAHRQILEPDFLRRAAGATLFLSGAYALVNALVLSVMIRQVFSGAQTGDWDNFRSILWASEHLSWNLPIMLAWPAFVWWRWRERSGKLAWFMRCDWRLLCAAVFLALVAAHAIPYPRDTEVLELAMGAPPAWENTLDAFGLLFQGLYLLFFLWWCGSGPGIFGNIARGAVAWSSWWWLQAPWALGMTEWEVASRNLIPEAFHLQGELLRGPIAGSEYFWYVQFATPPLFISPPILFMPFLIGVVLPWTLYLLHMGASAKAERVRHYGGAV